MSRKEVLLPNGQRMELNAYLQSLKGVQPMPIDDVEIEEEIEVPFHKMTVKELKEQAKLRNMVVDGLKKDEIVAHLMADDEL